MAINKLKVMLSIMRELNDNNIPNASDYGIEDHEFYDIVDACQDDGLIKNVKFNRGGNKGILSISLRNAKLTVKGLEYLDQHSKAMQTYKGLKEVRDWLPF